MRRSFACVVLVGLVALLACALCVSAGSAKNGPHVDDEIGRALNDLVDRTQVNAEGESVPVALVPVPVGMVLGEVNGAEGVGDVRVGSGLGDRIKSIAADVIAKFNAWRVKHMRNYTVAEATRRLVAFAENVRRVAEMNKRGGDAGKHDVNGPWADMTATEFSKFLGPKRSIEQVRAQTKAALLEITGSDMPLQEGDVLFEAASHMTTEVSAEERAELENTIIDWKHINTPVKNQGPSCGACWAVVAASVLESAARKAGKPLVPLSHQQLLDCNRGTGQFGCQGGFTEMAFTYWEKHGSVPEASYKYVGKQNSQCSLASGTGPKVKTTGPAIPWCSISDDCPGQYKSEALMIKALATYGPLAVGVEGNSLQNFATGILGPAQAKCGNHMSDVNHMVVLVGYNPAQGAWILRNSWGPYWGENGYFRLKYGYNVCGIANLPSFVTV